MRMTGRCYRFGRFRVDAATRELRENDLLVELPARAFDALVYLIEHRDRAVGRDELIAAVWGRADVSEALLNHTILRIRRALGSGQELIRTVPRFGYRWVGAMDDEASMTPDAGSSAARTADNVTALSPSNAPNPMRMRHASAVALVAIGFAILVVIAMAAFRPPSVAPATNVADATPPSTQPALPALVLPAEIEAPEDWSWLRLGVMDLVARRLRAGALHTVPSESVVALLKQRASTAEGDALLADPSLARVAALRVLPRVRLDHSTWTVRLDASGIQRELSADAEGADPIAAAREAANRLLAKLGHAPRATSSTDTSPELEELLQRSGAAMLADQLDQARALIEQAAPALRETPAVQQRMAQIELRAGEYDAVERRLLALLDRLDAKNDAALRARALITLASAYVRRGRFDKADEAYAEAIALRGDAKDPEALGIAYVGRGIVLAERGRFDDAAAELGRARIELATAGDPLGVAQVDVNLGDFQAMRHRPAAALPLLRKAAGRFAELGAREGQVYALIQVAAAERELLEPAAALATTERFWPPEAHTSNPRMQWNATRARIEALAANGRLREAQALIERIRRGSDPRRDAALRTQIEAVAARVALLRGDAPEAARLVAAALTPALRDSDRALYTRSLRLEGDALREAGDVAAAAASQQKLQAWADGSGEEWTKLQAMLGAASQAWAEDRRDAGLQTFADAMRTAERLAIPEDLADVGAAYAEALIEVGHIDEARSIAGRIAPWADRDPRAAWTEVRVFRALGRAEAERDARSVAVRLSGEARLPGEVADAAEHR